MARRLSRKPSDVLHRSGFTVRKVRRNLARAYEQASREDILEGLLWYDEAHTFAAELADETGLDLVTVCAVISALSPQTQWTANKRAAAQFLRDGTRYPSMLVSNHERAKRVLNARPVEALAALQTRGDESAPKIASFARNILGDEERVTVDTWALRAALGDIDNLDNVLSRVGMYEAIAEQYRWLARRVGISAPQAQAIVWTVVRRELDHRTVAAAQRRAA